jgi:uncharacterized membrane protein
VRRFYQESFDLITALGLAIVFAGLVLSFPQWQSLLRVGLGAVVMLFVPGYLMTIALFPQRDALHVAERVALTLGLSAITIIITGVVLNYLPVGIRPASIAVGIASASTALAALGGMRRSQLASSARFHLPRSMSTRRLLLGLVGFIGLIYMFDLAIPEDRFTEFYLLSATGELDNYPRIVSPGQIFELRVGITNLEGSPQYYLLRTPVDTDTIITVPRLADGERWELPVTLQAPAETGDQELVFELLKEDNSAVYRRVAFTIDVRYEQQGALANATRQAPEVTAELLEQTATNILDWLQYMAARSRADDLPYLQELFIVPPELSAFQVSSSSDEQPTTTSSEDELEARARQAQDSERQPVQSLQNGQTEAGQNTVTSADSTSADGTSIDDSQIDDSQIDDSQMDGVQMDGVQVDGIQVDGIQADGIQIDDEQRFPDIQFVPR